MLRDAVIRALEFGDGDFYSLECLQRLRIPRCVAGTRRFKAGAAEGEEWVCRCGGSMTFVCDENDSYHPAGVLVSFQRIPFCASCGDGMEESDQFVDPWEPAVLDGFAHDPERTAVEFRAVLHDRFLRRMEANAKRLSATESATGLVIDEPVIDQTRKRKAILRRARDQRRRAEGTAECVSCFELIPAWISDGLCRRCR